MWLVRLLLVGLALLLGLLGAAIVRNDVPLGAPPGPLIRLATYLNVHDVRTSEGSPFPELRPRAYVHGPSVVFEKLEQAVATIPGWRIAERDDDTRVLHAVVTSPLLGFEDDVWIAVVPEPMRPVVHVRARSRVGRGDLGANTRHVLDVYAALDAAGLRSDPRP